MTLRSSLCITLPVLYGAEIAGILALNFLIILVFVKNHSFRKRRMYLVLNLAVADVLVGTFSVSYAFLGLGRLCNFRKVHFGVLFWSWNMFPIASLTNLAAISIERTLATFLPLKHRVVRRRVYGAIIAANWLLSVLLTSYLYAVHKTKSGLYFYVWNSFNATCLFVICVSYVSIGVKVCCGTPPRHHRAVNREKRLTRTLFKVTLVSFLLWLPFIICSFLFYSTNILTSLSPLAQYFLNNVCIILYFANSLVNPIIYAISMPDFRRALISLCRRKRQRRGTLVFRGNT